jgi:hypothetical protein
MTFAQARADGGGKPEGARLPLDMGEIVVVTP